MRKFNDYLNEQLEDAEFEKEYNKLEPGYEVVRQIINARIGQDLTQKELADKVGIRQSNIARLESGNYNPSLEFLQKIAAGLGKELHIEFRDVKKV